MDKPDYLIERKPEGALDWEGVRPLDIAHFFDWGSDFRPRTQARLLYYDDQLYVRFDVADRYVRVVEKSYQGDVCRDSCVEFFVQPSPDFGYFNFEINAGGCMLLYYIPVSPEGKSLLGEQHLAVPLDRVQGMNIQHSLPARVDPEIQEACDWFVEYNIPRTLLEHYVGALGSLAGQIWRANFYKCADATSHPHRSMWSPIPGGGSFHRPDCFSELIFDIVKL